MSRLNQNYASEGFFGIGIYQPELQENLGSLWRSAFIMGASFIFTVGRNKFIKESSDVTNAWNKIPLYIYDDFEHFYAALPYSTQLIAAEMHNKSVPIKDFDHPLRAVYLLGCESSGLPEKVIDRCHKLVKLPGNFSLNVASAGSILIYDRISKIETSLPSRR
jgi:tRNA(Leu) C34 or U34 (ribose-2'-O)-methylase TrmL